MKIAIILIALVALIALFPVAVGGAVTCRPFANTIRCSDGIVWRWDYAGTLRNNLGTTCRLFAGALRCTTRP